MKWIGLKDSSSVKTNLFLSACGVKDKIYVRSINGEYNVKICFDDLTKGTTIFKNVSVKEFKDKFEILIDKRLK